MVMRAPSPPLLLLLLLLLLPLLHESLLMLLKHLPGVTNRRQRGLHRREERKSGAGARKSRTVGHNWTYGWGWPGGVARDASDQRRRRIRLLQLLRL